MQNIFDQPPEIREMMLMHLNKQEKLEFSLVSPLSDEVISNSIKLVKDVTIRWDDTNDVEQMLHSRNRKYRSMNYCCRNFDPKAVEFLKIHQKTLTTLRFSDCRLSCIDFSNIVKSVSGSLKHLHFKNVELEGQQLPVPIEFPNLVELTIKTPRDYKISKVFCLLNATNIRRIDYEDERGNLSREMRHDQRRDDCVNFVKKLTKLEWLGLPKEITKALIEDAAVNPPTFKLKAMIIPMYEYEVLDKFDRIACPNFVDYLEAHKSSLTHLWIDIDNVLLYDDTKKLLEEFHLKELRFHGDFIWRDHNSQLKNSSIERFDLGICRFYADPDYDNYLAKCNILRGCQGIKSLRLYNVNLEPGIKAIIAGKEKLKKLEMDECCSIGDSPLTYAHIESLQLTDIYQSRMDKMVEANPQLKFHKTKIPLGPLHPMHKLHSKKENSRKRLEFAQLWD